MITSGVLLALVVFIGLLLWDAFVTQSNGALSVGGGDGVMDTIWIGLIALATLLILVAIWKAMTGRTVAL